jgi:hypothetical protein
MSSMLSFHAHKTGRTNVQQIVLIWCLKIKSGDDHGAEGRGELNIK